MFTPAVTHHYNMDRSCSFFVMRACYLQVSETNQSLVKQDEFNFRLIKSQAKWQLQILMSNSIMLLLTVKHYLCFFFWFEILFQVCAPAGDISHAAYKLEVFDRMVHSFCSLLCSLCGHILLARHYRETMATKSRNPHWQPIQSDLSNTRQKIAAGVNKKSKVVGVVFAKHIFCRMLPWILQSMLSATVALNLHHVFVQRLFQKENLFACITT